MSDQASLAAGALQAARTWPFNVTEFYVLQTRCAVYGTGVWLDSVECVTADTAFDLLEDRQADSPSFEWRVVRRWR